MENATQNDWIVPDVVNALSKYFSLEGMCHSGCERSNAFVEIGNILGMSLIVRWNCQRIEDAPAMMNYVVDKTGRHALRSQVMLYRGTWGKMSFEPVLWKSWSWKSWSCNNTPEWLAEQAHTLFKHAVKEMTKALGRRRRAMSNIDKFF